MSASENYLAGLVESLLTIYDSVTAIGRSLTPVVQGRAVLSETTKRLNNAGWLPHHTTPFKLVLEAELERRRCAPVAILPGRVGDCATTHLISRGKIFDRRGGDRHVQRGTHRARSRHVSVDLSGPVPRNRASVAHRDSRRRRKGPNHEPEGFYRPRGSAPRWYRVDGPMGAGTLQQAVYASVRKSYVDEFSTI